MEVKTIVYQLLITGNGANRFMSCKVSKGKIDFSTAKNVNPDDYYRRETVEWLHDNYSYVENSIQDAPRHNDLFDRILVSQEKAENMVFLTHDSLIRYYGEHCIMSVL